MEAQPALMLTLGGWLREAPTQHKHMREVECIVWKCTTGSVVHDVRHCGVERFLLAGVCLEACSYKWRNGFQKIMHDCKFAALFHLPFSSRVFELFGMFTHVADAIPT